MGYKALYVGVYILATIGAFGVIGCAGLAWLCIRGPREPAPAALPRSPGKALDLDSLSPEQQRRVFEGE
jgi:hypothetical protein